MQDICSPIISKVYAASGVEGAEGGGGDDDDLGGHDGELMLGAGRLGAVLGEGRSLLVGGKEEQTGKRTRKDGGTATTQQHLVIYSHPIDNHSSLFS